MLAEYSSDRVLTKAAGRALLLIALALAAWMLTPARAAWACGGTNPTVLCVDQDVTPSGTPDGLSWTNAYTNVQDALDVTNANGATDYEIWVAEGVYYPDVGASAIADSRTMSFTLRYNNVQLYGGFGHGDAPHTARLGDLCHDSKR
jgi:hypothetical protein